MRKTNVVNFPVRPKTFTKAEQIIDAIREEIYISGQKDVVLAAKAGVSPSTIANLRIGNTRWPRPTTLFPLMEALGLYMSMGRIKVRPVGD